MWLGMVTASITLPLIILLFDFNVNGYSLYGHPEAGAGPDQSHIPFRPPMIHQQCYWQNQWIDCCFLLNNRLPSCNAKRKTSNNIVNLGGWYMTPNHNKYVEPLWQDKHKYSKPEVFFNKGDFINVIRPFNSRRNQQRNSPILSTTSTGKKQIVYFTTPLESLESSSKEDSINCDNCKEELLKSIEEERIEQTHLVAITSASTTTEDVGKLNLTNGIQIKDDSLALFRKALNKFQKYLHLSTFKRLAAISPKDRQENGVSFTYSSFFLLLHLMALTNEVDPTTAAEIIQVIGLNTSYEVTLKLISEVVSMLPVTSKKLKFPWASRLIVHPTVKLSRTMQDEVVQAMRLYITPLLGNETAENLSKELNHMVNLDSGGAMHDGFDEEDVSTGVRAILLTTLCLRPTWHIAPTLLNGTWSFHDAPNAPNRTTRMIRLNDVMRYADLKEFNAQAVEIDYATPGLSILIIIPRDSSLRQLMADLVSTNIDNISDKMQKMRVSVSLPIFTLRMTLLLPNKLQDLGISHLTTWNDTSDDSLRVSHAVQRLMFWSEPGRHAFKDDGIDWDGTPDLEILVNRPYVFHVRWQNLTLLSGNFVL